MLVRFQQGTPNLKSCREQFFTPHSDHKKAYALRKPFFVAAACQAWRCSSLMQAAAVNSTSVEEFSAVSVES